MARKGVQDFGEAIGLGRGTTYGGTRYGGGSSYCLLSTAGECSGPLNGSCRLTGIER